MPEWHVLERGHQGQAMENTDLCFISMIPLLDQPCQAGGLWRPEWPRNNLDSSGVWREIQEPILVPALHSHLLVLISLQSAKFPIDERTSSLSVRQWCSDLDVDQHPFGVLP